MERIVDIDYKKICEYYRNIIIDIFNQLSFYNLTGEDKSNTETEYLNAYGYLQRASWRLDELDTMLCFSNEVSFFWFAMENLSSARHRIEHYLENTEWEFTEPFNYKEYDDLVLDYYQPFRTDDAHFDKGSKWWQFYWDLESKVQLVNYIKEDINALKDNVNILEDYINKDYEDLDEERLDRVCDLLSELNDELVTIR